MSGDALRHESGGETKTRIALSSALKSVERKYSRRDFDMAPVLKELKRRERREEEKEKTVNCSLNVGGSEDGRKELEEHRQCVNLVFSLLREAVEGLDALGERTKTQARQNRNIHQDTLSTLENLLEEAARVMTAGTGRPTSKNPSSNPSVSIDR
uniref:Uncharacterized protein n=1 Tax=Chromera velia CCMP2878 TaxID=1169474 RepID=A0A0G4HQ63_9ALVE|eukprot:Cvel_7884.t1-p1 / transcript=Cvel_7884.t1 / gene=Cvel_7884 / organism=Chromera_velia_CCMP2878 / gene_product=hypothetical protein / transcript_product=hypothetical protein / location=Cvel_scaffold422:82968-83429(+) / protein_length=154 / sequence_SO=supercontig / SO=protein_coding / is_pseudo=false